MAVDAAAALMTSMSTTTCFMKKGRLCQVCSLPGLTGAKKATPWPCLLTRQPGVVAVTWVMRLYVVGLVRVCLVTTMFSGVAEYRATKFARMVRHSGILRGSR